jgi:hypothetical protein
MRGWEKVVAVIHDFTEDVTEKELIDFATHMGLIACQDAFVTSRAPLGVMIDHRGKCTAFQGHPEELLISGDSKVGNAARIVLFDVAEHVLSMIVTSETGNTFFRDIIRFYDDRTDEYRGYAQAWLSVKWGDSETTWLTAYRLRNQLELQREMKAHRGFPQKDIDQLQSIIYRTVDKLDRAYGRDVLGGGVTGGI